MAWVTSLEVRFCDNRMIILMHLIALTLLTSYLICLGNDISRVPWWSKQSQDLLPYRIFIWLCGSIFIALPVCSNGPGFLFWSVGLMVPKRNSIIHELSIVSGTHRDLSWELFLLPLGMVKRLQWQDFLKQHIQCCGNKVRTRFVENEN